MMFRPLIVCLSLLYTTAVAQRATKDSAEPPKIQLALLLDVSGSMDMLIQKTKAQFWRMTNYLGTGSQSGRKATLEIALVAYGLDSMEATGYTAILSDFTTDLDSLSDQLYQMETEGEIEQCWSAIKEAMDKLSWSKEKDDLRLLVIAGNESFDQGLVDVDAVVRKARKGDVVINTLYCDASENPVSQSWQSAAGLCRGSYFKLSLDDSLDLGENPLDNKLNQFNDKLNATYIPFGASGNAALKKMIRGDHSAALAGITFLRERIVYKAQDTFQNPSWDLVDAYEADSTILSKLTPGDLSKSLHNLSPDELRTLVEDKAYTRQSYKEAIRLRYDLIVRYLGGFNKNELNQAIRTIVDKEARKKKFAFSGSR